MSRFFSSSTFTLLLLLLLLIHTSSSSPRGRETRRRSEYDYYDYGYDSDDGTEVQLDLGDVHGLLPGEVDVYRNFLIDLMDILDDGVGGLEEEEEEEDEPAVVIIVVEDENHDPNDLTLASLLYDDDASWGPCTRSCNARRHRKCMYPSLCGEDEMLETALCYIPGSNCKDTVEAYLEENGYTIVEDNEDEVVPDDLEDDPTFDIGDYADVIDDYGYLLEDDLEEEDSDYYDSSWLDYIEQEDEEEEQEEQEQEVPETQVVTLTEGECGTRMLEGREGFLKIIGGQEARKGAFPWQVAILNRFKEVFCGGTLISTQWVLTAAHCMRKRLYVRVGEHDIRAYDRQEVEMRVETAIPHPSYDDNTYEHDIALLKLPREVPYTNYVLPACLPKPGMQPPYKSKCVVSGWGKESEVHVFGTDVLNYARVPIVTKAACRQSYPDHPITKNQFCAGTRKGTYDTCTGDSGGPLICESKNGVWTVHGVTSFGDGCGNKNKFGVYTKVVNYIPWIKETMREH